MRGIPHNFVTCTACGNDRGYPKSGRCRTCQLKESNPNRKYTWTPEIDASLRAVYAMSNRRVKLSAAVKVLGKRHGINPATLTVRASTLGLTIKQARWKPEELEYLRERAGRSAPTRIAKALHRSYSCVMCKASDLQLSMKVREGYSIGEASEVLGLCRDSIGKFIERKWLTMGSTRRIPEGSMLKFIRFHHDEYDLRRVDQAWFKGMVLSEIGHTKVGAPERAQEAAA